MIFSVVIILDSKGAMAFQTGLVFTHSVEGSDFKHDVLTSYASLALLLLICHGSYRCQKLAEISLS